MNRAPRWTKFSLAALILSLIVPVPAAASSITFKITLPATQQQPLTGRLFVIIARANDPEPRLQVGSWRSRTEMIAIDVQGLAAGKAATLDALTLGYPLKSVRELPAGDYYVQALLNVYTRFQRSDGNTIWAHMDQWEGQQFNKSPGNLYSDAGYFHLDPLTGYEIRLCAYPQNPHTASAGRYPVCKAHQDPEQAAYAVLGTAHLPGRDGAAAGRL